MHIDPAKVIQRQSGDTPGHDLSHQHTHRLRSGFAPTLFSLLLFLGWTAAGHAASTCVEDCPSGGILKLDRYDEREDRGIFSRSNQKRLDVLVIGGLVGTALYEGTESPLGKTAWKTLDGVITTAIATEILKNVVQRPRPAQSSDPNLWRQGRGNKSFPSGESAMMAAVVTPYIMEHHNESPASWALLLLPAYMGYARTASLGHWTSDVLAGAATGAAFGYLAEKREIPLVLSMTGHSTFIGFKKSF